MPHDAILEDWFVLSWAFKELNKGPVRAKSVLDFKRKSLSDDYGLIKSIREELDDVDVLIAHNGDKFDIRKLNARIIFHGLPPLPKIQTIDTLKEIRKVAQMTSNRLDYLSKVFTGEGKIHTSPGLWMKCMNGDAKSMREMVKYNKVDVVRLEGVYNKLLPYMKAHPHIGAMSGQDKNHSCNKCGSTSFTPGQNKERFTAAGGKKLQRQCSKCYSYSTFTVK